MEDTQERVYRGSALNDFNTCPQKHFWRWQHKPQLESGKIGDALQIGTLTHNCCHLWYKHSKNALEERKFLIDHYLDGEEVKLQFTDTHILEAKRLMTCLMEVYPTEEFAVLRPEVTVVAQLMEGIEVYLRATLDGIIQLNPNAEKGPKPILVLEHKTASQSKGPMINSYLKSPQIIGYTWIAKQMGYDVIGALYNFLVKTKIPDIVRLPTSISPKLMEVWRRSVLDTIVLIEENIEMDGPWRKNLSSCYNMFGECPYLPLCKHYSTTTLENYQEAREDPFREELVINQAGIKAKNGEEVIL